MMRLNNIYFKGNSIGFYLFFIYIALTYFPQFFFHIIFPESLEKLYNVEKNDWVYFLLNSYPIIAFFYFYKKTKTFNFKIKIPLISFKVMNIIFMILSLCIIPYSIMFKVKYGMSFRHSGIGFRNSEIFVSILFFYRSVIECWVLYTFFYILKNSEENTIIIKINSFIFIIISFLTTTGSFDIFILVKLILILTLNRRNFIRALCSNEFSFNRSIILLFVIVTVSIFIGIFNKFGWGGFLNYLFNSESNIIKNLFIRSSSHYVSSLVLLKKHIFDLSLNIKALSIPFESFFYRINLILEKNMLENFIQRPEFPQLTRLNYILTTKKEFHLPHAGASPGILASTYYIFIFPFGATLGAWFYSVIIKRYSEEIKKISSGVNIFGFFIFLSFLLPFFESPIDLFIIVNPTSVFAIFFIMFFFIKVKNK